MDTIQTLIAVSLLGVAVYLMGVVWQRIRAKQLRRAEQEAQHQEMAERVERTRQSFLKRVRGWDTIRSNPMIEGRIDGVLRRFLFIPVLPGHMKWIAGLVNSGKLEPISAVAYNNRDPGHNKDLQRQIKELKSGDCPVAPPEASHHLYQIALMGSSGDGNTMEEVPHDTVAEVGFSAIPMGPVRTENAIEIPPPAETEVSSNPLPQSVIVEMESAPQRPTLGWDPKKS